MNRQWIYATHPDGPVGVDNFKYRESPIPEPGAGQALAHMCYLSFEPAMRTWLEDFITYMPPVPLGGPMLGPGVAQVVKSNTPALSEGDLVSGMMGWQDYEVVDETARVVPPGTPIEVMLGPLGGTGLTVQVPKASADLSQWVADGEIAFRADVQEGFENIPTTFLRLFSGANQGKQLLKVRDPE